MQTEILAPAALLIIWSLVVLLWMASTRMRNLSKHGVDLGGSPGGRGQDLEGVLPDKINWKAHNYTHLMEQPTLYYAAVLILAMVGYSQDVLLAAWIYTIVRIAHSLWQGLVNTIPVRLTLFLISTFALIYMAVQAMVATF